MQIKDWAIPEYLQSADVYISQVHVHLTQSVQYSESGPLWRRQESEHKPGSDKQRAIGAKK